LIISVTRQEILPEKVVAAVKTSNSGCVATYVGLIRDNSKGKLVEAVEYEDANGKAEDGLRAIAAEIEQKWPVNNVAISHRIGKLQVGEVNFLVAIAAAHREEGFAACQYAVDRFKEQLPTKKTETYLETE
jgi:molybdopterin synthase catalytic subunit